MTIFNVIDKVYLWIFVPDRRPVNKMSQLCQQHCIHAPGQSAMTSFDVFNELHPYVQAVVSCRFCLNASAAACGGPRWCQLTLVAAPTIVRSDQHQRIDNFDVPKHFNKRLYWTITSATVSGIVSNMSRRHSRTRHYFDSRLPPSLLYRMSLVICHWQVERE